MRSGARTDTYHGFFYNTAYTIHIEINKLNACVAIAMLVNFCVIQRPSSYLLADTSAF